MTNKTLWESVCRTDPAHVKPITGKQYQGNSPKPYWIIERATDTFGPCGIGWGFTVVSERFERLTETDVLHVAHVRAWYVFDGKRGEVEQVGQTKATYLTSNGKQMVDEDAPKKSVTDALIKALSYIGFAGDIFSGRWDDSKYVAEVRDEYAQVSKPAYSDVLIDGNFPAWEKAVADGKITPLGIIERIQRENKLSVWQVLKIESLRAGK